MSTTDLEANAELTEQAKWVGQTLNDTYRIEAVLGTGGMATIFRAKHLRIGRPVALKVIAPQLADEPAIIARFRREAQIASRLVHPNIVQIMDFDESKELGLFIVMELLEGISLEELLWRGPLPFQHAVSIATQLGSALEAAHLEDIVHRDLKPGNVMICGSQSPLPKLLDFGISKWLRGAPGLTGQFDILGTPQYMAPEQASGRTETVDHSGDQFSLSCMVYEMLCGSPAFTGDTTQQILTNVLSKTPTPLHEVNSEIPIELSEVVARGLSKSQTDRFPSIHDFTLAVIDAAASALPDSVPPSPSISAALRKSSPVLASTYVERARARSGLSWIVKQAQGALDDKDVERAVVYAEQAIASTLRAQGRPHSLPNVKQSQLSLAKGQGIHSALSADEAFLLSRIDRGLSFEEALDASSMPRAVAIKLLLGLIDRGVVLAS